MNWDLFKELPLSEENFEKLQLQTPDSMMIFDSFLDFNQKNENFYDPLFYYNTEDSSKYFETNMNANDMYEIYVENPNSIKIKNNFFPTSEKIKEKYGVTTEKIFEEKKLKFNLIDLSEKKTNIRQHEEFRDDNAIQKIKTYFMKSLLLFLNNKYEKIMILNHQKNIFKFLRRIKYDFYKSTKIIENLNFLDLRIKDLFSKDISKLYSENSRNLNKENIDYFCNNLKKYKGGEELYNILVNKTVEEMLICYANGDYINEGFYLEVNLNKIK